MNPVLFKREIRQASLNYARRRGIPIDESHQSAVMFRKLRDNFHPESFANITACADWLRRTNKVHRNVPGALEMQSSSSSDALLMNIFCHPDVRHWKGIEKILGEDLSNISFGFPAGVSVNGGRADTTEIDMALTGAFCEAKLTETDFTRKEAGIVEGYDDLHLAFHVNALPRLAGNDYDNYQIIRNLLASIQHKRKHILLCDERRPDLVRRYMLTVVCLRNIEHRKTCRVVFWQELARECSRSLRSWLEDKYGMSQQSYVAYPRRGAIRRNDRHNCRVDEIDAVQVRSFEERISDIRFCRACAVTAFKQWKGWPIRDAVPLIPVIGDGECSVCGGTEEVISANIAWFNVHGPDSTGLPDYWMLVINDRPTFERHFPSKWGLPYYEMKECEHCGGMLLTSIHIPPLGWDYREQCTQCNFTRINEDSLDE